MKPSRNHLFLRSAAAAIALGAASSAFATTGTWNGTTTATWNTTATNWTGVTGTPWDSTNGSTNDAVFNLASLDAKVSGTVYTNKITATLGGTLSGSTGVSDIITFAGTTPTVSVATSQTLQLGTNTTDLGIAGSAGLKKTGAGILAIGGSSKAITGGIQVDAGTLRFTTGGDLGSNAITLGATGSGTATVLEWVNNSTNTSSNTVVINNNSGTKTLQVTSAVTATISSLTLNGNVTKTNAGTLILTNAGSRTAGSITVTTGTLQANSAAALPGYNVSGGFVFNGGTMNARVSGSGWTGTEVNSLLSNATKTSGSLGIDTTNGTFTQSTASMTLGSSLGALGLIKNGSNTLVLDQDNTGFTGSVSINAGTLRVKNSTALGSGTKNINMQGGSRVFELSNGVTLANNYTLRMSSNSFDGGGISSIDGTNAIQGNIEITSGNPALNISSSGTSTLTISGNITNVTDNRPLLFGGDSTNANTVSGVIDDGANAMPITKQGTGTWIFTKSNTYDGGTNINGGTLEIGHANALGTTGTIAFGGGTLKYGSGITTDLSSRFSTAASQAYKINTNGNDVTLATALNSSGGTLTKDGAGSLTLTTGGSYSGNTTVTNGKLIVNGSISTSTTTVSGTGTLGGSGTVAAVIVQTGGTLAPGNSIDSLDATSASFDSGSTFAVEINSTAETSDLLTLTGTGLVTLTINSGALLTLAELDGTGDFELRDRLVLANYFNATGTGWNGGLLTYGSNQLIDGEIFSALGYQFAINYDDTSSAAVSPFGVGDVSNGGDYLTLTVVPEPNVAALLGGIGTLLLLRRRRIA